MEENLKEEERRTLILYPHIAQESRLVYSKTVDVSKDIIPSTISACIYATPTKSASYVTFSYYGGEGETIQKGDKVTVRKGDIQSTGTLVSSDKDCVTIKKGDTVLTIASYDTIVAKKQISSPFISLETQTYPVTIIYMIKDTYWTPSYMVYTQQGYIHNIVLSAHITNNTECDINNANIYLVFGKPKEDTVISTKLLPNKQGSKIQIDGLSAPIEKTSITDDFNEYERMPIGVPNLTRGISTHTIFGIQHFPTQSKSYYVDLNKIPAGVRFGYRFSTLRMLPAGKVCVQDETGKLVGTSYLDQSIPNEEIDIILGKPNDVSVRINKDYPHLDSNSGKLNLAKFSKDMSSTDTCTIINNTGNSIHLILRYFTGPSAGPKTEPKPMKRKRDYMEWIYDISEKVSTIKISWLEG